MAYASRFSRLVAAFFLTVNVVTVPCTLAGNHPPGRLTGQALSAGKHAKNAKMFLSAGQRYSAACSLLDALDRSPKPKYLKQAASVVQPAYDEKQRLAQEYLDRGDYDQALTNFRDLKAFLDSARRHSLATFSTIDVDAALASAGQGVADKHYRLAEAALAAGDFGPAIAEYRTALNFSGGFRDAEAKIAESYYRWAETSLADRAYRAAAGHFASALEEQPGYRDAEERAKELFYLLGGYYLDHGYPRAAWGALNRVTELDADYRDASTQREDALAVATVRLAFGRFENKTGRNIGGIALGDFIFQELRSKVSERSTRFLTLTQGLTGADYIATGAINQASAKTTGPTNVRRSERKTWTEYRDKQKIPRSVTIYYREHKWRREVILAGNMTVSDPASGDIVVNEQIDKQAVDYAHWADSVSPREEARRLSAEAKRLLGADLRIMSEDGMIKRVIDVVADGLADAIIAAIDREDEPPMPDELPLHAVQSHDTGQ